MKIYKVSIPWRKGDTVNDWDVTCAWAIEQFGLPGGKYTAHPTADNMDFMFVDEKDAMHFSLRWC